jgi:ubiquinol-cytochrome c reductase cytochrome b subunit
MLHGSSLSRGAIWALGVVIWLFLCGACFTGYSLVYGQMSLWALVVICSLVTAIPVLGFQILELLWGGSVVSGVTVNRCFGVHFLLPFVLCVVVIVHLLVLHLVNSTGEVGGVGGMGAGMVLGRSDRINF